MVQYKMCSKILEDPQCIIYLLHVNCIMQDHCYNCVINSLSSSLMYQNVVTVMLTHPCQFPHLENMFIWCRDTLIIINCIIYALFYFSILTIGNEIILKWYCKIGKLCCCFSLALKVQPTNQNYDITTEIMTRLHALKIHKITGPLWTIKCTS